MWEWCYDVKSFGAGSFNSCDDNYLKHAVFHFCCSSLTLVDDFPCKLGWMFCNVFLFLVNIPHMPCAQKEAFHNSLMMRTLGGKALSQRHWWPEKCLGLIRLPVVCKLALAWTTATDSCGPPGEALTSQGRYVINPGLEYQRFSQLHGLTSSSIFSICTKQNKKTLTLIYFSFSAVAAG